MRSHLLDVSLNRQSEKQFQQRSRLLWSSPTKRRTTQERAKRVTLSSFVVKAFNKKSRSIMERVAKGAKSLLTGVLEWELQSERGHLEDKVGCVILIGFHLCGSKLGETETADTLETHGTTANFREAEVMPASRKESKGSCLNLDRRAGVTCSILCSVATLQNGCWYRYGEVGAISPNLVFGAKCNCQQKRQARLEPAL